jgi:lipopolysaccharide assembly outer membrane protein LptD (OstA)
VIEPRITYKYVSGVKQFNDTLHFDPLDLINDTSEMTIGVTNRLYAKRGDTVTEILSWQLSQRRYFEPDFGGALIPGQRNVLMSTLDLTPYTFITGRRTYSPIVSTLRGSPRNGINFTWEADYDPLQKRIFDSSSCGRIRLSRATRTSSALRSDMATRIARDGTRRSQRSTISGWLCSNTAWRRLLTTRIAAASAFKSGASISRRGWRISICFRLRSPISGRWEI